MARLSLSSPCMAGLVQNCLPVWEVTLNVLRSAPLGYVFCLPSEEKKKRIQITIIDEESLGFIRRIKLSG